jgi:hypothetical protein
VVSSYVALRKPARRGATAQEVAGATALSTLSNGGTSTVRDPAELTAYEGACVNPVALRQTGARVAIRVTAVYPACITSATRPAR